MNFDRIAPIYQILETTAFGHVLQRARTYWIDKIPRPTRALIIGEGNGRLLCELLRAHPKIEIDCVDASARMLKLADRRVRRDHGQASARVRFHHSDILDWSAPHSYDLLVTPFFLDCFPGDELKRIIGRLAAVATPNASWLVADFATPSGGRLARAHANVWLQAMYWFFRAVAGIRATRLVDPSPCLQAHGFTRVLHKLIHGRLVKSELWQRSFTAC